MKQPLAVIAVRRQLGALRTGANVYLFRQIEELRSDGFRVHLVFAPESSFGGRPLAVIGREFLAHCEAVTWPRTLRIGRCFISLSWRVYARFFRRIRREIIQRLRGRDTLARLGRVSEPLEGWEARMMGRVIDAMSPDRVIAEYSALGPILNHITHPATEKVVLLHDLFSLRAKAMRDSKRPVDFADMTLAEEALLCEPANTLIYASQAELDVFRELLPDKEHRWLAPNYTPRSKVQSTGQPKALFMGVRHVGNLDALEYLMEEIWPKVIARNPDAELLIVGEIGSYLGSSWRQLPGIKVLGVVDDLTPLGGPNTIGLAPTRVASGISIKIAAYLQLGMTVLASHIALTGYGSTLDRHVITADDANDFAENLSILLGGGDIAEIEPDRGCEDDSPASRTAG